MVTRLVGIAHLDHAGVAACTKLPQRLRGELQCTGLRIGVVSPTDHLNSIARAAGCGRERRDDERMLNAATHDGTAAF